MPASSHITVGLRVAGVSPEGGVGGYEGGVRNERMREKSAGMVERSVSVFDERGLCGTGDGGASFR